MSSFVRRVFIEILPRLLCIERPLDPMENGGQYGVSEAAKLDMERARQRDLYLTNPDRVGFASPRRTDTIKLSEEVQDSVDGINFIVEHVREAHQAATVRYLSFGKNWKKSKFSKNIRNWEKSKIWNLWFLRVFGRIYLPTTVLTIFVADH